MASGGAPRGNRHVAVRERQLGDDRLRIVDVGARGGLDPRWERFHPVLELVAFEPDPDECERLNRGAASLPYPARFLPHAVWREANDEVPFHVVTWPVASSSRSVSPGSQPTSMNANRRGSPTRREARPSSSRTLARVKKSRSAPLKAIASLDRRALGTATGVDLN